MINGIRATEQHVDVLMAVYVLSSGDSEVLVTPEALSGFTGLTRARVREVATHLCLSGFLVADDGMWNRWTLSPDGLAVAQPKVQPCCLSEATP